MIIKIKKYKFINIVIVVSILFSVVPNVKAGWFFNLFKTSNSRSSYKNFNHKLASGKSGISSVIGFSLITAATVFCIYKFIGWLNKDNQAEQGPREVINNSSKPLDSLNLVKNKSNKEQLGSFAILAEIDQGLVDNSFDQLMKNTGTYKHTNNIVTLGQSFEQYSNFYCKDAKEKDKRIFKDGDKIIVNKASKVHLTLAEVGKVIKIGGVEYVESFVGGTQVKLEDAVNVVLKAIRKCEEDFKEIGDNYNPRLEFELEDGAMLMYSQSLKKANVWVAQKLKLNKDKNNRFYILGTEIQKALAEIGLKGHFDDFAPHISIANISAINTKNKEERNISIIDLLKSFEKDKSTVFSQILGSVKGDVAGKYFDTITINKGFNQEVNRFLFSSNGDGFDSSGKLNKNKNFENNAFAIKLQTKNGIKQVLINLKKGDLTTESFSDAKVSAIVNAANPGLVDGSGVTGAIWKKSGGLTDLCAIELASQVNEDKVENISSGGKALKTGKALITGAKDLKNVKYVIHTPAPHDKDSGREKLLDDCYENSLALADQNGVDAIAFPSLGTGIYNFPIDGKSGIDGYKGAKEIAIDSVINYLENNKEVTNIKEVRFIMMGKNYNKYLQEFQSHVNSGKLITV